MTAVVCPLSSAAGCDNDFIRSPCERVVSNFETCDTRWPVGVTHCVVIHTFYVIYVRHSNPLYLI